MKKRLSLIFLVFLTLLVLVGCGVAANKIPNINFVGEVTIDDVHYDVDITGENGNFELKAGNLPVIKGGLYTFTEGQGFTLSFNDTNKTDLRSKYNRETFEHSFVYQLDLGARGIGNVELRYKDVRFKPLPQEEEWSDIPFFFGIFNRFVDFEMVLSCKADGTFTVIALLLSGYIDEHDKVGEWTFEDGVFKFTLDGEYYESTYDEETDTHTLVFGFTMNLMNPNNDKTDCVMTYEKLIPTVN